MYTVVFLRHGESTWNKENRFTGWTDVDLSDKGREEAERSARLISEAGLTFDLCYTSMLRRAIRTLWIVLDRMDLMFISGMQKITPVTAVPTTEPVNTTTIPTTVPTTVPTTIVTTLETTAVVPTTAEYLVPTSGIWVKVSYDKEYTGLIGSPGNQDSYTATGENLYRVRIDNNGTVAVSLQKTDGSGDELEVTIYKDGTAVKTASTSAPKGKIDLQFLLATPTPTPTPTETVTTVATTEETSGNTSVNSTSTSVTTSTA